MRSFNCLFSHLVQENILLVKGKIQPHFINSAKSQGEELVLFTPQLTFVPSLHIL